MEGGEGTEGKDKQLSWLQRAIQKVEAKNAQFDQNRRKQELEERKVLKLPNDGAQQVVKELRKFGPTLEVPLNLLRGVWYKTLLARFDKLKNN